MADFLYDPFFAQGLGFVAFGLGVWAFLCKDDHRFKKFTIAYCAFLVPHFYLLGAIGAAMAVSISTVRTIFSLHGKFKNTAPIFILLYLILGVYRYEIWIDLLPIMGSAVTTFGLFYLKKIPMRLCCAFSSVLWLTHNVIVVSLGPIFMEALLLSANLYRIYGLYHDRKAQKKRNETKIQPFLARLNCVDSLRRD